MKLICTTKNPLSSIANSVKFITTKLPLKVVVASALLIGVTGSMAMDSIVLTAPSYAKTVSKTKVSTALKRVIAKKPVKAQSAVKFKDAKLEAVIRKKLNIKNGNRLTLKVLQGVKVLDIREAGITSLEGIKALRNLTTLYLGINKISDLKPLSGLTKLTTLDLGGNKISDLKPLSGLTNLTFLGLAYNHISDVQPLSGLTNLTGLDLEANGISDVKPLSGLTNLTYLRLSLNLISDVKLLTGLTKLTTLDLFANKIIDVQPLAGLRLLTTLWLYSNPISNCQLLREELRNDCPTPPVPLNKLPERLLAPADR